ncbi:hypothetical protein BGZ68_001532 [Mortierella alpina]|nr:hypothetical protein BGZ68_001532 [Mortierella alpina]
MSISIDGGPIEGIFGSQLEQRVVAQVSDHEDGIGHRRRHSEGRESIHSTADARLLSPSSPAQAQSSWLALPWRSRHAHKAHKPLRNSSWSWWPPRMYSSVSPRVSRTLGHTGSFVADRIQYLQSHVWALFAASISNKRRKSWFLTLLLVSLALTVFSGGFLLNQLHHQRDLAPQPLDPFAADGAGSKKIEPGALDGPRRDRNRGKKHRVPKTTKPAGQTEKGKTIPEIPVDTPKTKGNTTEKEEEQKVDRPTELDPNLSLDELDVKKDSHGQGMDAPQGTTNTTNTEAPAARICSLEDVANGRWVYSKVELETGSALDLSWTGYGPKGCRSNIWNERYLLTPSPTDNATATSANIQSQSLTQRDLEYARQLKRYRWQLNTDGRSSSSSSNDPQGTGKDDCRQPPMDVIDLVEVLKRSPLVMIGDKFLEQEFLTLECMIMGMQDQLLFDSRSSGTSELTQEGKMMAKGEEGEEALDYLIEVRRPDVVELKIAPVMSSNKKDTGSDSAMRRPAVYRKAKPGQMRLVDRASNTTLITFVRSDVLWDSEMMTGQVAKHALKSVAELSVLDAGGLHPDCKLVGSVVLCESAHNERRGQPPTKEPGSSPLWALLGGFKGDSANVDVDEDVEDARHYHEDSEAGEMAFGSDLERDMINLEWVSILEDIVRDSAAYVEKALEGQQQTNAATAVERKPMVLISNGHVWEYDPEDAVDHDQGGNEKLSKMEQDVNIRARQQNRRKQLRRRYAMVLSNTLDYIKSTHPDMRVMVQTSVRRSPCESGSGSVEAQAIRDMKDEEAALFNALTKTVVAKMQSPLYSFLDTTFLRLFKETMPDKHHCDSFMMPGPLDTLVHQLYGELYRLDL